MACRHSRGPGMRCRQPCKTAFTPWPRISAAARSPKPWGVEAYHIKPLERDVLALAEQLSPGRPFSIVGHGGGASVGYAAAIAAPRRVAKLMVINGVHPGAFSGPCCKITASVRPVPISMICAGPRRRRAYDKLVGMLARFGAQLWLTPVGQADG